MANNAHGLASLTSACAWNIDAMKIAGICDQDLDNGVFVTLGDMNLSDDGDIMGYEYNVVPADATSIHCYMVRTPEVGASVEMQVMADPRYFYNEAGRPLSLCWIAPHVDHIEVDANCFADAALPQKDDIVGIGADGKLAVLGSAPAAATYFTCVGFHSMDVGQDIVPTAVLRCEMN